MGIKIVTDSTCDLPKTVIDELGITIVPLFINIGEKGYLDGVDLSRKDFYTNLPDYATHPTTGTPGTGAFHRAYDRLHEEGATKILSIHISRSLSATVDIANTSASEYEKAQIIVRDSQQLSLGTGYQVELAAKMAKAGSTMDEILAALNDLAPRTFVAAGLDTLEFLRRSGRMNRFMMGLGSLLQLKPILTMKNGLPGSERVRTSKKAEERLISMVKDHQPIERFGLLHTNAPEKAEAFRAKVADLLPDQKVYSMNITPVIGAHIGPGAVGFVLVSKK